MKTKKNRKFILCIIILLIAACPLFIAYKYIKSQNDKIPKVSIIVPVYNTAEFLPACLDSIVNQTYKEIEIICVNDGSEDNSLDVLTDYKNKYPQIVVIDKPNGGVSSARNSGLRAARGKYVQFMDSDDLINCKTCQNLIEEAEKFDADIVLFRKTWFSKEAPDINQELEYGIEDVECYFHEETENPFINGPDCNVIHNKFYKKDFLINNNLFFDERIRLGEDSLFCWMSFIRKNTVVVDKNIYYYYRMDRGTSLMNSSPAEKWFYNHMLMMDHLVKHKEDFKFDGYKEWILDWAVCYAMEMFGFGSDEEKSQNAKLFFDIMNDFIISENVQVSKENAEKIQKIKNLIKD